jgi:hypothetical protein
MMTMADTTMESNIWVEGFAPEFQDHYEALEYAKTRILQKIGCGNSESPVGLRVLLTFAHPRKRLLYHRQECVAWIGNKAFFDATSQETSDIDVLPYSPGLYYWTASRREVDVLVAAARDEFALVLEREVRKREVEKRREQERQRSEDIPLYIIYAAILFTVGGCVYLQESNPRRDDAARRLQEYYDRNGNDPDMLRDDPTYGPW